jgi:hypothetical protein
MAISWGEAKEYAAREGLLQVYHDCDADVYGACRPGETQGAFKEGIFLDLFSESLYPTHFQNG